MQFRSFNFKEGLREQCKVKRHIKVGSRTSVTRKPLVHTKRDRHQQLCHIAADASRC